ncbi:MAG: FIG005080: Possible exported protein [uncultured Solirubrobacteraceae bacterium]|uniref:FIG005080: Possible exported protein n=1 Tax=uncultured Solirubrobacteraceae bacterium TaxID=1162706 RepID=A0A6J4RRF4_9ACTN|nr:MAG: FIG005080: Possible exported protein [uncultured Solirubrobacteraceae bacterium]
MLAGRCSQPRLRVLAAALFACALALALVGEAQGAPGELDNSFSGDGKQITDFAGGFDAGGDLAVQRDGKIVVAGGARRSDVPSSENFDFAVARYHVDGSLDDSFSGDGKQTTDFGDHDSGSAVAVQADGKILVAGTSGFDLAVVRYNADGTLDASFGSGGKLTTDFANGVDAGQAIALQADGRIVVAGSSHGDFALARYNADGSLDSSFSGDGKQTTFFNGGGSAVAIQADGKIVIAGHSWQGDGRGYDFAVARYDADGSLDSSFTGDGSQMTDFSGNDDGGGAVAVQGDGRIVVVGAAHGAGFALARYNADGSLDNSFSGDGTQTTSFGGFRDGGAGVALQADGRIVVAGSSHDDFALARYHVDGSLDSSFAVDGKQRTDVGGHDAGGAVALQADGRIVVAGFSGTFAEGYDFSLARFDGDPAALLPPPALILDPPRGAAPRADEMPAAAAPPAGTARVTAKLQLARATVDRRERVLDVFAPITSLASGRARVELQAAGRRYRFAKPVDARGGRIRFRQRIPAEQARLGTGILTISYPGDADTRPQSVRLRAAARHADLRPARPTIADGRLRAAGTISSRARGAVRVQIEYATGSEAATLQLSAAISNGRWSLNHALPQTVRDDIARRTGTVHAYTLFTGYLPARMRGEMRSFQILGDR